MNPIAIIKTDFPEKFGIPRQSGLVESLEARIIFEPEFRRRRRRARAGGFFSHIWLIWEFSEAVRENWSPTVRPPRLGGNVRMGVFATRSPFRPNPLGLSCVKLKKVELHPKLGPVLYVAGADLMDGTPIYDIKPYIPYADCHPEAVGGFTTTTNMPSVTGGLPAGAAEKGAGGKARGAHRRPLAGPAPALPEHPGAHLRDGLCGHDGAVYRGRRHADGSLC